MKFIRESIALKIFMFVLLIGVLDAVAGYFLVYHYEILSIPTFIALGINLGVVVLMYIYVHHIVHRPLKRIHTEIHNLLTGKEYQHLVPHSIDELGVFTHFFNEITQNLEGVSTDLREQKRMSSELEIARTIQKEVFPTTAPAISGLDIVAKTRSAAEIGGDSFDFLQHGDDTFTYIGDVTGHGVPSGLVMMMVDTLIDVYTHSKTNCRDVLVETNKFLHPRIAANLFMTLVMLRWNKKEQRMYFSGCGHEHILVYRAETHQVDLIKSGGIALGMIPDVSAIIKESTLDLKIGDVVVLYTDGITEARNFENEMYTVERLVESFKHHGYRESAEIIFDKITEDFSNFVGEYIQADDITLIVAKYTGEDTPQKSLKLSLSIEDDSQDEVKKKWDWE